MKIYPQKINFQNFAPYGTVYDLKKDSDDVIVYRTQTFVDRMIEISPFGEEVIHLGMTEGLAAPCTIRTMEIHPNTEEVILCIEEPVILCVALWNGKAYPTETDIRAFELHQGQVAVLKKNVWHDACHGIGRKTYYCWFAKACSEGLGWVNVHGSPELETLAW